ncbi:MAG TPA: histidine kinase [Rubricoccaceae bacterium]|jgi:signal transduction histidine kinase
MDVTPVRLNAVRPEPAPVVRGWRLWALSFATWTTTALVGALRSTTIYVVPKGSLPGHSVQVPWTSQFVSFEWLPNMGWALLTPLIVGLGRRYPLVRGRLARHLPIHIAAALVAGLLYTSAFVFIGNDETMMPIVLPTSVALGNWHRQMAQNLSQHVVMYVVILAAGAAFDLWARRQAEDLERAGLALRASRLEGDLAEARLAALQAQLHPHFLFNTLHAVSALVDWRPADARRMLTGLAELLRLTLAQSGAQTVRLDDDLDWLERYLDLQRVRFEDRLVVDIEVEPEALSAEVPALVLQPLVENALLHGVAAVSRPCWVSVRAGIVGDRLRLTVDDDGPGLDREVREGIGLSNTRARLRALYGANARLELLARPGGGARSLVEVPYRPASGPPTSDLSRTTRPMVASAPVAP